MAKQRRNYEGTVYYDKLQRSYRVFITTPDGKRFSRRFETRAAAVEWQTEQRHQLQEGTYVAASDLTVGEWSIQWLKTYKKNAVRQRTFERYAELAKHLQLISRYRIQELTSLQVQKLYQELLQSLSASTVYKVHKILMAMFKKAVQIELLARNIMLTVEPPKPIKKEISIFSAKEIHLILATIQREPRLHRYYPIVLLASTTGMRLGELLALKWENINEQDNSLYIQYSIQQSLSVGIFLEQPKTKASQRKIQIPCEVMAVLIELKQHRLTDDPYDLCFHTRTGKPIAPRSFERFWKALFTKYDLGLEYKNFHCLRHTHATELLAAGIPLSDVAKRLGHSKQSHTLELYAHAMPRQETAINKVIENLYSLKKGSEK